MDEDHSKNSFNTGDILDILMGSDLYFDLPVEERYLLVKHITRVYEQAAPSPTH